ncbi:MAG TPA: hypothetical protein VHE55_14190 [Fimbriimonadaceae bacterium]|nr:hypothetical protein [Fimbriimonadaceae bacterium]
MLALSVIALLATRQAVPPHLTEARRLVEAVRAEETSYRHNDSVVIWPGEGKPAECRTDCSGLWDALIPRAYPPVTTERLQAWLGKKRPRAEDYFAVMKDQTGFRLRKKIADIQPGDFIAIKYEAGADNTGHTMIVDAAPGPIAATAPLVEKTSQYSVLVIDVTSTPHGPTDSRGKGTGLGRGTIRLYANPDGTLAGHAWSLSPKSKFRPMSLRPIQVGEIDPTTIPRIEQSPLLVFLAARKTWLRLLGGV